MNERIRSRFAEIGEVARYAKDLFQEKETAEKMVLTVLPGIVPERWYDTFLYSARIPPEQGIDAIAAMVTQRGAIHSFGSLLSGERLTTRLRTNQEGWIPSETYKRHALYAGKENTAQLRELVIDRINRLDRYYEKRRKPEAGKPILSMLDVKQMLPAVETFMDGYNRRTGEEGIAHIYRILLDAMEFAQDMNDIHDRDVSAAEIDEQSAALLLAVGVFHDLQEDELKWPGNRKRTAKISYLRDESNQNMRVPVVRVFDAPGGQAPRELSLPPMPKKLADFLQISLDGLRTDGLDHPMNHLWKAIMKLYPLAKELGVQQMIPALIKVFDRNDNLRTYTWEQEEAVLPQVSIDSWHRYPHRAAAASPLVPTKMVSQTPIAYGSNSPQDNQKRFVVKRDFGRDRSKIIAKGEETDKEFSGLYVLMLYSLLSDDFSDYPNAGKVFKEKMLAYRASRLLVTHQLFFRKYAPQWAATALLQGYLLEELYQVPEGDGLPRPYGTLSNYST